MRRRPIKKELEEEFINKAQASCDDAFTSILEQNVYIKNANVKHFKHPSAEGFEINFEEGSALTKSLSLPLKEFEWNTLDRHTKELGVTKSSWIRYAIFSMISKERSLLNKK